MSPAIQRKAGKMAATVFCSIAVVVAVALLAYCDGSLHDEQRIDQAFDNSYLFGLFGGLQPGLPSRPPPGA
ncbi:MAG: hypothetical protein IJ087_15450 [Eggerthellaceae bacterium]|nr:hypothetical protein [Eggerthellaceae bacterium]